MVERAQDDIELGAHNRSGNHSAASKFRRAHRKLLAKNFRNVVGIVETRHTGNLLDGEARVGDQQTDGAAQSLILSETPLAMRRWRVRICV